MRIISKPKRSDNGFPIIGVATLLKDSDIKHPKEGMSVWNGYASVERLPKGTRDESVVYSMTAMSPLADKLIAWPAKTRLFFAGSLIRDDYWSKRKGSDVYKIMVEFIHDQHDYAAAAKAGGSAEDDDDGGTYDESSYDPGF